MNDTTPNLQSAHKPSFFIPGEEHELQLLVDSVFCDSSKVDRVDIVVKAETDDLSEDVIEVVNLLPSGVYDRDRLCDQINSIIVAHGWSSIWGTVE